MLQGTLVFTFIDFTPLAYGDYVLPDWAQALGWCMALVSVIWIPIVAIWYILASYKMVEYNGLSLPQVILIRTLWQKLNGCNRFS